MIAVIGPDRAQSSEGQQVICYNENVEERL